MKNSYLRCKYLAYVQYSIAIGNKVNRLHEFYNHDNRGWKSFMSTNVISICNTTSTGTQLLNLTPSYCVSWHQHRHHHHHRHHRHTKYLKKKITTKTFATSRKANHIPEAGVVFN
uniref:Uncharacterized protein n=1 Tax=Glossina pallidipes TaxID=7398 RepID=A0A1B0AB47_GLOPL